MEPTELVEVTVPRSAQRPPTVHVTHPRFVGYPHVLNGLLLCIYLDPSREWSPDDGAVGFLNRLWGWFEAAAGGKFDPHTALFHAVGGTDHTDPSTPTVVVRHEIERGRRRVFFSRRSDHRFDMQLDDHPDRLSVPVVTADAPLPLGPGTTIFELSMTLDDPDMKRGGQPALGMRPTHESLYLVLVAAAKRNSAASPQPFVLRVPHPAGGTPHVLVGSVSADIADALRGGQEVSDPKIAWWRVSDERASVTTRRDSTRPTVAFAEREILLIGCGGLGSWIAEFIARAGARRIVLSDSATITGGLLVRQNYTEADLGSQKEAGLAKRLRAINDSVDVEVLSDSEGGDFADFDLIIDATVSLALSQSLSSASLTVMTVQVAVDPRTASTGMVLIKPDSCPETLAELDHRAGKIVGQDPRLEDYHSLWSPGTHDMLVPTRGCSVPTFHGSAADLASAAGVMVSLVGQQLLAPTAGVHLFSLPHSASPDTPASVFITLEPA
ncbi:thiamine biosynthesis protein ThiF [Nesterenkonia sphaerica]|uniref:Thiamine biosynthesis protein ThiF n=1 Tax=Nesterenkonia sphaerica TaxID=1804988 RepID=A0A5R9A029_9MICC|nr:thiamine biosynthesis protein ThiF [Nesterenkonia sphaerica]